MKEKIVEGRAKIRLSDGVFYNPKMRELRDISVMFLKACKIDPKDAMLDSTSATGVRGIRYALEVKIRNVMFLDMNRGAYLNTKRNVSENKIKAIVLNKSIQEFCNTTESRFDFIDLDPFGSPAPNIYDLMKVVKEGTMLMVTATDMAVLCGAHPNACLKIYGAKPLHGELCHESAVRILIGYVAKAAAQFNFGVEVKFVVAHQHYIRVFLGLRHGAERAVYSVKQLGFGNFCVKCHWFGYLRGLVPKLGTECENCGNRVEGFGPVWLGGLYDKNLVKEMLRVGKRDRLIDKDSVELVERISEEYDTPFFYSVPKLTKSLKLGGVSPDSVIKGLNGYETSRTQFDGSGIKTNAGIKIVTKAVKMTFKRA